MHDEIHVVTYVKAKGMIQCGAKVGHGGPLLQKTSSDQNATAANWKHINDLAACGKKWYYFWFRSEVFFLTRFDVVLK